MLRHTELELKMRSNLIPADMPAQLLDAVSSRARTLGINDVEITLNGTDEALTRFANNEIHQNVAERHVVLSLRLQEGTRTARVSTDRLDPESLDRAVAQAAALTRASEPDPDLLPLYHDSEHPSVDRYSPAVADFTARDRALQVQQAIGLAKQAEQTAAGAFATGSTVEILANSAGLYRCHEETQVQFSITSMAADSSGWAKLTSPFLDAVDPMQLTERAIEKARRSASPIEVPPGEYTVILEPAAVLDLVGQIFGDFSATALEDQRSFLNERLGTKLFGENISIYDEVACPLQAGAPFDGEGVPRRRLHLVEKGVAKEVAYSRWAAARAGVQPTGHGLPIPNEHGEWPVNIVMAGGRESIDDLIRSTSHGILVTRLWYIREVEPYEKVMTGMTRDGTFLIRDGAIASGIRNLRFNVSVVELLRNVEALGESVRSSGEEAFDMVVPALKVNGFRFTEVTKY
ncbi:MAG TPA: TldD/PmbA family protein [Bryobacteraceae bacterium]|nr:TldD/PmbA family protein [Bryobacteraceae bacterium]